MARDRSPTVFVVSLIFVVLATFFLILRLVSKWGITKKSNPDDWLVLVGWAFTLGLGVSVMIGAKHGLGKHDEDIRDEWQDPLRRAIYAFTIFYNPAIMATKSAILLLYLRMATAHRFLKIASLVVLAIVNIAGIVLTFLNIFQCRPVSAAFTESDGKCIDLVGLYLSSAPVNVITDLAILLLPLPILTALRIEFRQKVVLVATFIVGGFVAIVDIIRIVYLQNALRIERAHGLTQASASVRPPDFIYEVSFTLMWSTVEVTVGLICACALVLKPLVMRVTPALLHRQSTVIEPMPTLELSKLPRSPRSPLQRLAPVFEDQLPIPNGAADEDGGGGMDFMQMLAMDDPPPTQLNRNRSNSVPMPASPDFSNRRLSRKSIIFHPKREQGTNQQPTQTFFDFVNMSGKKPLTELTPKEAWRPIMFVSLLFFLWGFAYGLLGTLNGEIQSLMDYNPARSIALHSAYWMAYFFSPPLIGYWVLTRSSFQSTFITGLVLYAIGALSFWPSSVLLSYPGFFISNFIIALGLACLEIAGNPFIALAGPAHLSETRLNFSQGIQAIGSVVSPILAKRVLFNNVNEDSLFNIQWCYLAVALFVVAVAVVFYYVPLSEAPDDILEATSQQALFDTGLDASATLPIFGAHISARTALLIMGCFTMALYVGAQETISYFFGPVSTRLNPRIDPFWVQAIAHAVFALGRFLASAATYIGIPPRYVLLVCCTGCFIFSLISLLVKPGRGSTGVFVLISFFESAIFPTVFAITLRNQGAKTKLTSAALVTAISGGGLFPGVSYGASELHPNRPRYTLVVVVILYGLSMLMPGWLCGGMRKWVDPLRPNRRMSHDGTASGQGSGSDLGSKMEASHVEVKEARDGKGETRVLV